MSSRDLVIEAYRREFDIDQYAAIRRLYKAHSIAEDARDLPGLLATLTPDCRYEIASSGRHWDGHEGAASFYGELLGAFPDIVFELRNIVIGPQGVWEEADVTGTWAAPWLGMAATGDRIDFLVQIYFPWDPATERFRGERIYVEDSTILGRPPLARSGPGVE